MHKSLQFEFILRKLLEWYEEANAGDAENNDLSILKSLKLLFFVSASNTKKETESLLLENSFNCFVAMPYGHVESEIYSTIKENKGQFENFSISNRKTTIKDGKNLKDIEIEIDSKLKAEIEKSIKFLKEINYNLILMSPFDLVELSHAWYSWKLYYSEAKKMHTKSMSIPPDVIKSEDKIYSLQMI